MSKSMKDKDVEYKTKEAANLDKTVTELTSDQDHVAQTLTPDLLRKDKGFQDSEVSCRIGGLRHLLEVVL